ncbi:hypothetical protein FPV67DRAFT_1673651 [Lyophyllum atratum]|nr:hypothetical protein FPV67DRAFT_1673651 [Lyophyllum atratum]
MTRTVVMPQQTAILLAASSTDVDGNSRVVRFDNECVLIPAPSKRPKISKTYSLPLWKKRSSDCEPEATTSSSRVSLSPEETHVVFKVPIPRFISRSPSRGRSTSASPPTAKPLSPCLVYRSPSSLPSSAMPQPMRRTSLPITRPKGEAALTVPLRACCADCVTITEESMKEGEQWQEKFSRGARRRRSASLDNSDNFSLGSSPSDTSGPLHHSTGFAAVAANAHGADIGPSSNPRYRASTFAITVDEVDQRRKSQEYTEEELSRYRSHSPSRRATPAFHSTNDPYSAASYPLTYHAHEKEASTSSTSSSVSEMSPNDVPPRRPKSSPIQEEDEDQLFPLPSPRRSPNNSPSPSKSSSPAPSPNASTSYLPPAAVSKDSLSQGSSGSDDALLSKSLSRKTPTSSSGNGLLSPSGLRSSPLPSPSMLTATAPDRMRSSSAPGTSPGASPPKPQLLPLTIPTQPHARANSHPVRPLPSPSSVRLSPIMTKVRPLPIPPSPRSPTMTSMSTPPRNSGAAFPASASRSPPSSPVVSSKSRRSSFSLKDVLKGAGADVLKGVSSIGGSGGVGSV